MADCGRVPGGGLWGGRNKGRWWFQAMPDRRVLAGYRKKQAIGWREKLAVGRARLWKQVIGRRKEEDGGSRSW